MSTLSPNDSDFRSGLEGVDGEDRDRDGFYGSSDGPLAGISPLWPSMMVIS
jgi:hypothetical protein